MILLKESLHIALIYYFYKLDVKLDIKLSTKYGVSMDIKLGVTPGAKLEGTLSANKNLK